MPRGMKASAKKTVTSTTASGYSPRPDWVLNHSEPSPDIALTRGRIQKSFRKRFMMVQERRRSGRGPAPGWLPAPGRSEREGDMVLAKCPCHQGRCLEFVPTPCLLKHAIELHPPDKEAIRQEL